MTTMQEVHDVLSEQNKAFDVFMGDQKSRLEVLEKEFKDLELKLGRPSFGGFSGIEGATNVDPGEIKTVRAAVRALLLGDQSKANHLFIEAKAMATDTDPSGGYVVHPMISAGMTKVMAEISPLYRLARKVPMTEGDAFEEPIDKESADANWVAERQTRDDTDTPDLAMFRVTLQEICAMPKATQKLIDVASIDVLGWLQAKVGDAFAVKEGSAFHIGDGVGKPRGFLTYPTAATPDATRTWGTFEHVATGTSGAFPTSSATVNPADVLVDVTSALKAQYRNGAVWLMNRKTAAEVRKLKDSEGRHVWVDSLVAGQPPVLLGYAVEIDEDMPDIGAGSLSIAFGNFAKAYTIVEQPGAKFLTDPYTDKPNVRLFAYRRVGADVNNAEAVKFLKFSAS